MKKSVIIGVIVISILIVISGFYFWHYGGSCIKEGEYVDHPSKDSFECCEGLVKQSTLPVDDDCKPIIPEGSPGIEPGWTCINCGDGICKGGYENKCNCPVDCE